MFYLRKICMLLREKTVQRSKNHTMYEAIFEYLLAGQ